MIRVGLYFLNFRDDKIVIMKTIFPLLATMILSVSLYSQTYIDPVDNTDLESYTSYIITIA